jgi:hypothetical protein
MFRPLAVIFSLISIAPAFSATPLTQLDPSHRVIISIRDQKLMLMENGGRVAIYRASWGCLSPSTVDRRNSPAKCSRAGSGDHTDHLANRT